MPAQHCVKHSHCASPDNNSDSTLTYSLLSTVGNLSSDRQFPMVDRCLLSGMSEVGGTTGGAVALSVSSKKRWSLDRKFLVLDVAPSGYNFWKVDFSLTPTISLSGRSLLTPLSEVGRFLSPPCPESGGVSLSCVLFLLRRHSRPVFVRCRTSCVIKWHSPRPQWFSIRVACHWRVGMLS
jgi:hypothetical protein